MNVKIKFTKVSSHQFLYQLSYGKDDSYNSYYIKFVNTEENIKRLSALLNIDFKVDKEYELPIAPEESNLEKLIAKVVNELDKNIVPLSDQTKRSIEKKPVLYTYRSLDKYKQYWEHYASLYSLFNELSEDIIEIPYADDERDSIHRFEKTAYHVNHGTNHAIRQYILNKNYLGLLKRAGNVEIKSIANTLSKEEKACIELASFLFRSGRTNERSWNDDSTYGKRSAEIFFTIAKELGFNEALINLIAGSYDYHGELIVDKPLPQETLENTLKKGNLFRVLLQLSHESDLVRCKADQEDLKKSLHRILSEVLEESFDTDKAVSSFFDFAVKLCQETGARVDALGLNGNDVKAVDATHQLVQTCRQLNSKKPSIHPKYKSPTQSWLESDEHVYIDDKSQMRIWSHTNGNKCIPTQGWTDEQINLIPISKCIKYENKYIDKYFSVYHATTKASRALELLSKAFAPKEEKKITWHRVSKEKKNGITQKDIELMKVKSIKEIDNTDYMSWHLLSCNPTVLQNSDFDSQESSADYFVSNSSVKNMDFSDLIGELLDTRDLLIDQKSKRAKVVEKFHQVVNDEKYGQQGVLYQHIIPHNLIDEIAYVSGANGKLDIDNPSAFDALSALSAGEEVPNQHTFQIRLLVPKMMEPNIAGKLKVKTHSTMTEELECEFNEHIKQLAEEVLADPVNLLVVKREESTKESSNSHMFNALRANSQRSEYTLFSSRVSSSLVTSNNNQKNNANDNYNYNYDDDDDPLFNMKGGKDFCIFFDSDNDQDSLNKDCFNDGPLTPSIP